MRLDISGPTHHAVGSSCARSLIAPRIIIHPHASATKSTMRLLLVIAASRLARAVLPTATNNSQRHPPPTTKQGTSRIVGCAGSPLPLIRDRQILVANFFDPLQCRRETKAVLLQGSSRCRPVLYSLYRFNPFFLTRIVLRSQVLARCRS
jgi:hypothetical protein